MRQGTASRYRDLLRRSTKLAHDYAQLLSDLAESGEATEASQALLLPYPFLRIESQCPLAASGNKDFASLLTAPGQRDLGLKELRDFTARAMSLIIVDPYLFSGKETDAKKLAMDLEHSARLGDSVEKVHFVHANKNVTITVKQEIESLLESKAVAMTESVTSEIHDRVWIADRIRAIAVGTSLNGIGKRAAFLLLLPEADLAAFLEFLDDLGLSG